MHEEQQSPTNRLNISRTAEIQRKRFDSTTDEDFKSVLKCGGSTR